MPSSDRVVLVESPIHDAVPAADSGEQPRITSAAACPSGVTLVLTNVGLRLALGDFRMRSSSISGSGCPQLRMGGMWPRFTAIKLAISSTEPEPETRLPR